MVHMGTPEDLKRQAKRLRTALGDAGTPVSHAQALELLAHQLGYRDWNTLHAAAGNRPAEVMLAPGDRVSGTYLGHPVTGKVLAVSLLADSGYQRISIDLDEAVDVVKFDSFSAFRKRISATIDPYGVTAAKTSDGEPHLRISRA